jgi:hypothetical protein
LRILTWVLSDATPGPKLDKSRVEPGWIGLVFFVVMACAIALLWFSMRKQMGRIDVGRHQRDLAANRPGGGGPTAPPGGGPSSAPSGGTTPPPGGGTTATSPLGGGAAPPAGDGGPPPVKPGGAG